MYGKGTGFGNRISIQTVAIVKAAKAMRRVCKVDDLEAVCPGHLFSIASIADTLQDLARVPYP